jgi:formiminotetrahydrofolate cyclodeaminase
MAAALLEKVAKLSQKRSTGAIKALERAVAIRTYAEFLIEADANAYMSFVEARRSGSNLVETARAETIEVPAAILRLAADATQLASELVLTGNPNLRSDAHVAGQLALAGAYAALITMTSNLPDSPRDRRLVEARRLARSASARLRPPISRGSGGGPGRGRARPADSRLR